MSIRKTGILFLLFVLAYFPCLQWMWDRWFAHDTYYSHGIFIPLITALLIWQKRDILKRITPKPSSGGIWLFAAGIAVHLLSVLFRVYFTSGFSMILVLAGFVWCAFGKDVLKEVSFPIIFLIFMVPLPLVVVINLSFQLKLLSAQMAAGMLNLINIPAIQQGSYIRMSHTLVVVEDVCSGLRSLISLLALSALFAYWMRSSKIRKVILFFSAVPIALICNMFRIMILAIISECWGTKYVNDLVHTLSGLFVFVLAFLLLSLVARSLKQVCHEK